MFLDVAFRLTLAFVAKRRGGPYLETRIRDRVVATKTVSISMVFEPAQCGVDLSQFLLGPLELTQRHLLLLNCAHPSQATDRLI